MLQPSEIPPEHWAETGIFSVCETLAELFLTLERQLGLDAVEKLLIKIRGDATREMLRTAADQLGLVGLKPLAALVRKHARKAKPARLNFKTRWPPGSRTRRRKCRTPSRRP